MEMIKNELYEARFAADTAPPQHRALLGAERQASEGPAHQLPRTSSVSVCLHLQQELTGMGTHIPAALQPVHLHGDQYHVLASKTFTVQL